jgi:hypothetical protein
VNAPREGCPAWCTGHDDELRQHQTDHRFVSELGAQIGTVIFQGRFDSQPRLFVGGIFMELRQAPTMAQLMRDLKRSDVAAVIDELAATIH